MFVIMIMVLTRTVLINDNSATGFVENVQGTAYFPLD